MNTGLRILVVDDDPMMAKTLSDILNLKGHRAQTAHSGREALCQVRSAPFDCVLSDIRMPDLDGVQLCQQVKVAYPRLPVILMTAYSKEQVVAEGIAAGVAAVLSKPVDIPSLLDFVQQISPAIPNSSGEDLPGGSAN